MDPEHLSQVPGFYYKATHQNRICHPDPQSGCRNLWEVLAGQRESMHRVGETISFSHGLYHIIYCLQIIYL